MKNKKMNLEITKITNKNNRETIFLTARADINLKDYVIYDTTFAADGKLSNKGRHVFPFPELEVKSNQQIFLVITSNIKMKKPLTFYWHRKSSVINNTGDHLVLLKIENKQNFLMAPQGR